MGTKSAAHPSTALFAFSTRGDGDLARGREIERARFWVRLGVDPAHVVAAEQVHGATVARVGRADRGRTIAGADALVTDEAEVALMLVFADCVPILLHDPVTGAIGAVHAGWRGTARQIVAEAVRTMHREFGSDADDLRATIGPAIGLCCYEVSDDVAAAVAATVPDACVTIPGPSGRPLLDLQNANRAQLEAAGLRPASISWRVSCTACQVDRYFSHRAEAGRAGRMAALIGRQGEEAP